jgi:hypothetical protein
MSGWKGLCGAGVRVFRSQTVLNRSSISQFSNTITICPRQLLIKGKGLFWLTFLVVPVHGQVASLLWISDEALGF